MKVLTEFAAACAEKCLLAVSGRFNKTISLEVGTQSLAASINAQFLSRSPAKSAVMESSECVCVCMYVCMSQNAQRISSHPIS
jgi:hypothetical protein